MKNGNISSEGQNCHRDLLIYEQLASAEAVGHLLLKIFRSRPKTSRHQGLVWCKQAATPAKDLKLERQKSPVLWLPPYAAPGAFPSVWYRF